MVGKEQRRMWAESMYYLALYTDSSDSNTIKGFSPSFHLVVHPSLTCLQPVGGGGEHRVAQKWPVLLLLVIVWPHLAATNRGRWGDLQRREDPHSRHKSPSECPDDSRQVPMRRHRSCDRRFLCSEEAGEGHTRGRGSCVDTCLAMVPP